MRPKDRNAPTRGALRGGRQQPPLAAPEDDSRIERAEASVPWPEAEPEIEAAKDTVRLELMGQGSVDLRARRVITALWQRGWRPSK